MTHEAGIEAACREFYGHTTLGPAIERAIQAYLSASGMVLVPRKPTEAMSYAGAKTTVAVCEDGMDYNAEIGLYPAEDCFERMIEAVPDPFEGKS